MAEESRDLSEGAPGDESIAARLNALVSGLIQQTQTAVEQLLPVISGINSSSMEVSEDVQRLRDMTLDRKNKLEEEKEKFQQAACSVLDLLATSARE